MMLVACVIKVIDSGEFFQRNLGLGCIIFSSGFLKTLFSEANLRVLIRQHESLMLLLLLNEILGKLHLFRSQIVFNFLLLLKER